jgi:creatinine amidohydrolase
MIRPWILAEKNFKSVRKTDYTLAVLPWGATEPHNFHLPYGTDVIETEQIAAESARIAWEAGARVAVLPAVPFGVNTGQLDLRLTINMNPSTQQAVLTDIVDSLEEQGIPALVILNGHGGNDFKPMIREMQGRAAVFVCAIDTYRALPAADFFDEPGDHAGEMETSLMMHLAPELVLPLSEAGEGATRRFNVAGLREGWAWTPREWSLATVDTGAGDPSRASAAKGARYFAALTEKIASFLVEVATTDVAQIYEDHASS